jgi:hypothetical protein
MLALLCSFQGPREKAPAGLAAGLSKLNSMQALEAPVAGPVDMLGAGAAGDPRYADLANRPLHSWSSLERR